MKEQPSYKTIVEKVGAPVEAIVTGVGQHNGLAVMRGLGRMGVPVHALGDKDCVGFYSRYATKTWVTPDNHHDPEGFMQVMEQIGKKLKAEGKRGVLFATRDSAVEVFATNERLREYFICHFPPAEVISACSDKMVQYRTAERVGVPYPQTYFEDDLERLYCDLDRGEILFPVICKSRKELPFELRKKFRLAVFDSKDGLRKHVEEAVAVGIHFLVQNVIPGGDDTLYTLGSCLSKKGEMKAIFTGRKLRQQPPLFGICRVGESMNVPELISDGEKLLKGLGYFGISQVETKYDHRDGKYKLIEVNPRTWGWVSLPIEMGINLPYAYFCDALGVDTPTQPMVDQRAVWISATEDLYWSLKARDGKPWAHFFKGYDSVVESYYRKDDRKPGLVHFGRCGKEIGQAIGNRLLKTVGLKRSPKK